MPILVHKPVLLAEVIGALELQPGGCYADGTVGAGGHSSEILRCSVPDGKLYGCDRDKTAIEIATARLAAYSGRFELRVAPFSELESWIGPGRCDGAVLDLGISSMQLGQPERGFSFQIDGPLDMRMSQDQPLTAASFVNDAPVDELARVFWEFGGERHSYRLARSIEQERQFSRIDSTRQLAAIAERAIPRRGEKIHPATRMFQAIRIKINEEVGQLRAGLKAAWAILKPGGRLAIISFHSIEDRIVKEFGRGLARDYAVEGDVDVPELRRPKLPESKWVNKKAIQPDAAEIAENPRARSAQLRLMEKL